MRNFFDFVVANVRSGAVQSDGKTARVKLKEYRSREARAQTMLAKERLRNTRTAMKEEYRGLVTALNRTRCASCRSSRS